MDRRNIPPQIWGPKFWDMLLYISYSYPKEPSSYDKSTMRKFVDTLRDLLPCQKCRKNFDGHIMKYPLENYLNSPEDLIEWVTRVRYEVYLDGKKGDYDRGQIAYSIQKIHNEIKGSNTLFSLTCLKKFIRYVIILVIGIFIGSKLSNKVVRRSKS